LINDSIRGSFTVFKMGKSRRVNGPVMHNTNKGLMASGKGIWRNQEV
jgi:hypothetical protein